jgi:hypothetical protein
MSGGQQSKAGPATTSDGTLLAYIANSANNDIFTVLSFEGPFSGDAFGSPAVPVPGQSSVNIPALYEPLAAASEFEIAYLMAYVANNGSKDLFVAVASPNGNGSNIVWNQATAIPDQSSNTAPALAFFNNKFVLAYVATNGSNDLIVTTTTNIQGTKITWGAGNPTSKTVPQSSRTAPALCVFNSELYLAYVANNSTNDLLITKSSDGISWSPPQQVTGQSSKFAPALAVFPPSNLLVLAYVANNSSNDLLVTAFDGTSWEHSQTVGGQSSKAAPALCISFDSGSAQPK